MLVAFRLHGGPAVNSPRASSLRETFVLALSAALALSPSPLRAQDAPPADAAPEVDPQARAAARKTNGDEAMEALRYEDALAAYSDAYAITKNPALLYNMGRALEALNRFPEALEKLTAFEAAASPELKARVPRLPTLIAELRQHISTLDIHTNVEGARIVVRNVVVGKSPLSAPLKLVAGPAEIEVDAEGYFGTKKTITLEGGAEQAITLDLFSRTTTGVLTVRASTSAAEVFVNGKRIGIAPVELNVPKGTHRITVRHPDFRAYETSAVVPAGGYKAVTATLQTKSIATRWWFWTGVGAVAAAGAAITIAATTERDPSAGTIAPGQLSTGALEGGGATLFRF
jgi:hypothetical protein